MGDNGLSQLVTADGNTKSAVKKSKRSRGWCFTWNNYTNDDIKYIEDEFKKECHSYKYVFQEEIGDSGTPHVQGCFYSKEPIRFETVKNMLPKCHIEPCKKWKKSIEYCSKPETRNGKVYHNIKDLVIKYIPKDPLKGKELYEFQKNIIDIINGEPDDRTIRWYYDENGCKGKSALCKHLIINRKDIIVCSGKVADVKYGITKYIEKYGIGPRIIIFDFVRSNEEYISYEALESVKNGYFYNTKYESEMVCYEYPHVICMANFKPDVAKLTADRWIINEI